MTLAIPLAWLPLAIFLARIADVSLGTVRTIAVVKGRILIASILGFVEVLIWVIAVSNVVTRLDQPLNLIAWAAGFAVGNAVGIFIERKLALGDLVMRIISRGQGAEIAESLRNLGQRVTEFEGKGRSGPVQLLYLVMDRVDGDRVERLARAIDEDCVVVSEDVRHANIKLRPMMTPATDWRGVLKRK
jgi:uncharacterized protein YebE (UPF0316 family)